MNNQAKSKLEQHAIYNMQTLMKNKWNIRIAKRLDQLPTALNLCRWGVTHKTQTMILH